MEHIDGMELKKRIEAGPLPIDDVVDIAKQAAEGLQTAHEKGVVHRDIKSSNIMVTPKGQIKIMDFGLAKLADSSFLAKDKSTMGTVAYMSPEQAHGKKVDRRADLWSFGVVLYEMLTSQLPFQSDHEQVLIYAIINETPEPISDLRPDAPPALAAIVNKALTKNADKRYQNIEAILADLQALQRTGSLATPAMKTPRRTPQQFARALDAARRARARACGPRATSASRGSAAGHVNRAGRHRQNQARSASGRQSECSLHGWDLFCFARRQHRCQADDVHHCPDLRNI
jgi:serine/threonine-protein kinase